MTSNMFGGTLNLVQSINLVRISQNLQLWCSWVWVGDSGVGSLVVEGTEEDGVTPES